MEFSASMAKATKPTNMSDIEDSDEEEPGEEIESAPPLKVGEEREINTSSGSTLKKKLLKSGRGWETPEFGDEVTVHYVGTLLDGSKFDSSRDKGEPFTFKLGSGEVVTGLDHGIITMNKGEIALFTLPSNLGYGSGHLEAIPPNSVLQFEVELISWIRVIDICKDGGLIKKILLHGFRDEQPGDLDQVTVKYQAKLVDGSIVAETPEGGVEFYVKDGRFFPALAKVLKTMKWGEKVMLTVQPQYAFGEEGKGASDGFPPIPSNAILIFDLELVSFKAVIDVTGDLNVLKKILKDGEGIRSPDEGAVVRGDDPLTKTEKQSFEMNNHERIEAAGKKKEEGNKLFKSGKYRQAVRRYEKATEYVSEDQFYEDDEQKLIKPLIVSCWLNNAACRLKLNEFREAVRLSSKVLDMESHNVKALYRRAQAYIEASDLDLAELDVKKALEVDPQNREVKSIQKTLKQLQVQSNKRDAKLYCNMFARMKKETTVEVKRLKVEQAEDREKEDGTEAMDEEKHRCTAAGADEMVLDSC